ncbi:MAG: redox-regulated ATPase YchF [Bacteroidetes bacterium]|nr:redox-regulated ATPase YchF [Bacteroidota bacterium]
MVLPCGIVGLPNAGKSSLFKALTGHDIAIENFPYTTTESNFGVVNVPDHRLNKLSEMENPQKTIPNTVEFIDIAGLAKGASQGEGLGNSFLDSIRHSEAIIHVIRCFDNDHIVHINTTVDPVRDKEELDFELQLKDLETVAKSIERNKKAVKSGDKKIVQLLQLLEQVKKQLDEGGFVRQMNLTTEEWKMLRSFSFLTGKKILYAANVDDAGMKGNKHVDALKAVIGNENSELVILNARLESEIAEIEDPDERIEFMQMFDLREPGVNVLIHAAYHLLDLITFFTIGKNEVRAWATPKGSTAPQSAGVIHSDFERGFIRAEMIKYEDYVKYGSEQACKDHAKFHVVGKDYVVQDGDQLHFLFNV